MRKDVKIGLAIGGLLLAVLVVYLLVPKDNGTGNSNQLAQNDKSADTGSTGAGGQGGASGSGTGGAAETPSGPAHLGTPKPADTPAPGTDGATQPPTNEAESRPSSPGENDERAKVWAKMLETGVMDAKISLLAQDKKPPAVDNKPPDPFGDPKPTRSNNPSNDTQTDHQPTGTSGSGSTPVARSGGLKEHVVQPGETLSKISLTAYGDPRYHDEIKKANPDLDERHLRPGTTIKLPDPSTFKKAPQAQQAAATINSSTEYRVEAGDSLHKIAMKLYGKADKADAIYELNKDKIGSDPARVKIGTVLKLPEAPHAASTSR